MLEKAYVRSPAVPRKGAWERFRWFVRIYLYYWGVIRPCYYLLGVFLVYLKRPAAFVFAGRPYRYFYHFYGLTYLHERAVEIPIGLEKLQSAWGRRVLEVGNVLSHYISPSHDIVDKYERAPGVQNLDVVEIRPAKPYDVIISISTLEHVGWDERPRDPPKVLAAVESLIRCLAPGGEMFITFPLGYNDELDGYVKEGRLRFTEMRCLKRVSRFRWSEAGWDEVRDARYNTPFRHANAVIVGVIRRSLDGAIL